MEDLLFDSEHWVAVDPCTIPTGMAKEDWEKLERKAISTIRTCLSYPVLVNVSREDTIKKLWDKLGNLYQSKSLVIKLFLQKTSDLFVRKYNHVFLEKSSINKT